MKKEKLYEKAKKNGLIGNKEITDFTDKEIYRFITLPLRFSSLYRIGRYMSTSK